MHNLYVKNTVRFLLFFKLSCLRTDASVAGYRDRVKKKSREGINLHSKWQLCNELVWKFLSSENWEMKGRLLLAHQFTWNQKSNTMYLNSRICTGGCVYWKYAYQELKSSLFFSQGKDLLLLSVTDWWHIHRLAQASDGVGLRGGNGGGDVPPSFTVE